MATDNFVVAIADADQYRITFAGVAISRGAGASGYADGPFLDIKPKSDAFIDGEGTDGTVWRSKTNSRLFDVMIHVLETNSQTNGFLSSMLALDEQTPNGAGVGTFVVEDLNGTTFFKAIKCWVKRWPDVQKDRGAKERSWLLRAVKSAYVIGGN